MTHLRVPADPDTTPPRVPLPAFDPDPLLDCADCGAVFRWSSSVDESRCDHCATLHAIELGEPL